MSAIQVSHLNKYFQVHKKKPGLAASLTSLFHREYFEAKAVDDVSFDIEEGELVGFIGPNGAGKTTTLKCLSGLLYPTKGEIQVLGYHPFERRTEFLKKIALVMGQKNQLWWDLPAMESFLLNKEIYEIEDHVFKKTVGELIELLQVGDVVEIPVRKLSLGQRMKCELIAALLHGPRILFLDEPTIGLDIVMQKNLREFIRRYNEQFNATILLTSHYMGDVKELCKRIIIIDHGHIYYDGSLESVIKKHSTYKTLTIIFHRPVDIERLKEFGEIKGNEFPKVTLSVPYDQSNHAAAKLLDKFPVEDLNIEEPTIEDIIRDVFTKKKAVP